MKLWQTVLAYGRMIKFSHTLFALPFAGISFLLAYLQSPLETKDLFRLAILSSVCMFSARSAAMGFNRYVDAEMDGQNPRTEGREIPTGQISRIAALLFISVSGFVFVFASYLVNHLAFLLSFPALALLFIYSLTKRFTLLCHLILGLAIGLAPLGAWIAVTETLSLIPILFSLALIFHIAAFDILYALQDLDFDVDMGLHSIPSKLGERNARYLAFLMHLISFMFFYFAGEVAMLGLGYFFVLALVLGLIAYEHKLSWNMGKSVLPPQFFQINSWVSLVLFIGIIIDKWSELVLKLSEGISLH